MTPARVWWAQAHSDLEAARFLLEAVSPARSLDDGGRICHTLALCCQASEKAIKALWWERMGSAPSHTHGASRLLRKIERAGRIPVGSLPSSTWLHLIRFETLTPSSSQGGPNTEYPWLDGTAWEAPCLASDHLGAKSLAELQADVRAAGRILAFVQRALS